MKATFFNITSDGSFALTPLGYLLFALIIFGCIILAVFIYQKTEKKTDHRIKTKQITYAAIAMGLSLVTANIKLFHLPFGGSITLLSMFFITLIGFFYGPGFGVLIGIAFGFLQLIIEPYIISLPQLIVDYPLAFGALGLSGFFANKKNGLILGYLAGIIGRLFFSTISGVIFFGYYAADYNLSPFIYSLIYNGCYIGGEGIITCIIIMIPGVRKSIDRIKEQIV